MKDYYKILNVDKAADSDEIKKAYRKAAVFWHPDKNQSETANEKFLEINEAYRILIDVSKRKVYDRLYEAFYKSNQEEQPFRESNKEYRIYEQWVNFERLRVDKSIKISADDILTETFHFIDKYGWIIFLTVCGIIILFALVIGD